jgi:hypothetical protein
MVSRLIGQWMQAPNIFVDLDHFDVPAIFVQDGAIFVQHILHALRQSLFCCAIHLHPISSHGP